ncbi:YggT family protein [Lactobacillus sp. ESL0681]|uniref:YggT family protein n=1 Tax=Lactobacillus sp. ESL0681 TaxID=2983211 RepID=UPI0023F9395B|nr:YggT family protein [Lactobacillus sp. ESL0681]WEV40590.1 YggT family protein [Lactobacillus sp. ESL0681]
MWQAFFYILNALEQLIGLYSLIMVFDAIMSWIPFLRDSAVGRLFDKLIDPYLRIFRKGPIQRFSYSTGLDLSFLIGLLLLYFAQDLLKSILFRLFS